ncbi:MAG: hypothetical protein H7A05_00525 [Pseudomonadales bacterium]|nr:hypothetical protein [Pseudomonadales bacterium]MCP5343078.1 hypothetical protein [Pseudomonadales bacterium]
MSIKISISLSESFVKNTDKNVGANTRTKSLPRASLSCPAFPANARKGKYLLVLSIHLQKLYKRKKPGTNRYLCRAHKNQVLASNSLPALRGTQKVSKAARMDNN